jgi:hypothetical protein
VAELLVACTVLVGPDRALATAIAGVGVDAVTGALPYLQRAALTPHTRDLARSSDVALTVAATVRFVQRMAAGWARQSSSRFSSARSWARLLCGRRPRRLPRQDIGLVGKAAAIKEFAGAFGAELR